jgi:glycosyltransferase involved in cell wall biosynthesis
MPVYNCDRTLAAAVQSILNQTFENWELLILDDGSTDRTLQVAQSFRDERIRVVADGEHKGLVARLNRAIQMSSGKYIARMDADDVAYPERLERQVDYLERHPEVDLVGCSMLVFGKDGTTLGCRPSPETHEELCRRPSAGFHIWHPTWMGRMEWFRARQYDPKAIRAEDQVLLLRSYLTSRFACLPEILQGYRESRLFLGKILRSRYTFTTAACREFLMRKKHFLAIECAIEQFTKAIVDLFAISSGLNHQVLRHRARPVATEIAARWSEVWTQVNT